MRVAATTKRSGVAGRAAVAALAALVVGLVLSFVAAALLRSAAPGEQVLARVAPTPKLAVWTLAAAHGVPIEVTAGAQVESNQLSDIGELFGRPNLGTQASLVVRLAPLTLLALVGLLLALAMRTSAVEAADVLVASAIGGLVYGTGLALLAAGAGSWAGLNGSIVRFGVRASVSPLYALVAGFVWAAIFLAIGARSKPEVQARLSPLGRGVWTGMAAATKVATVTAIVALIALAIGQASKTSNLHINPRMGAVGVALFGVNVIATAIVVSFGAPLNVSFSAGPLAGWTRLGYFSAGQTSLSPARWLFVFVPLLSGLAAGRAMRRHVPRSQVVSAAVAFGAMWGVVLSVVAWMVRVRILSNFDIAAIAAGGGASINPLLAFPLGAVIAGVLSYVGMLGEPDAAVATADPAATEATDVPVTVASAEPDAAVASERTCDECGAAVPTDDRFCGACGQPVS
jgi:hypothetical protein